MITIFVASTVIIMMGMMIMMMMMVMMIVMMMCWQVDKMVLLVLGCAVTCPGRVEHISVILDMEDIKVTGDSLAPVLVMARVFADEDRDTGAGGQARAGENPPQPAPGAHTCHGQ